MYHCNLNSMGSIQHRCHWRCWLLIIHTISISVLYIRYPFAAGWTVAMSSKATCQNSHQKNPCFFKHPQKGSNQRPLNHQPVVSQYVSTMCKPLHQSDIIINNKIIMYKNQDKIKRHNVKMSEIEHILWIIWLCKLKQ